MSAWADLTSFANASNGSFHALVMPLALMTKLTYTATEGSYYNPSDRNATIADWERPMTVDPPAGMRALFFVQESTHRGVIAFRGTDLNFTGASGLCDQCAGMVFGEGQPPSGLPAKCRQFSNFTLDYFSRAVEFVAHVRRAYPHIELLFTGHSLGAGLAFALAAITRPTTAADTPAFSPAVAFAVPPHGPHVPLPLGPEANSWLYALADEWDPVQRLAVSVAGWRGTQCLWRSPEPPACAECYARGPINITRPPCALCFEQRHVYAHYLKVDVPGPRPRCAPLPEPSADVPPATPRATPAALAAAAAMRLTALGITLPLAVLSAAAIAVGVVIGRTAWPWRKECRADQEQQLMASVHGEVRDVAKS